MDKHILAINPGSTSTKIAVYLNTRVVFLKNVRHPGDELKQFQTITDQYEYRKEIILHELKHAEIDLSQIEAVVGRGGLLHPIKSGVYSVNDRMKEDLRQGVLGEHASNLGGLIADDIAKSLPNARAFIADPVVVDELEDVARITGHPKFSRVSIFHALNHKAVGRAYARLVNRQYEEMNLVIAHLGGGISIGAHEKGKVIDVNQALDGEGPLSPERAGTLPAGTLAKLCFSGEYSYHDMKKLITGEGGLMAWFGTNNAYEIEMLAADGNARAMLIQNAMAYQVGKAIGAMSSVLKGEVDTIILTGGIAHNTALVEYIKRMVSFIAPVVIYPGEDEMHALAMNGLRVLRGELECKEYNESNMIQFTMPE
jgi:butyrate kinase